MTVAKLNEELRAELAAWENEPLSREEFEARVSAPWSEREREDFDELVAWFRRRYSTVGERSGYIRRRMSQLRADDSMRRRNGL